VLPEGHPQPRLHLRVGRPPRGRALLGLGRLDERLPEDALRPPRHRRDVQHDQGQTARDLRLCLQEGHGRHARVARDRRLQGADLATAKFEWDHPVARAQPLASKENVTIAADAVEAARGAHGVCVLTEWDEFREYDYQAIYDAMLKPAFVFDGRNILDHDKLRDIGFVVYALGKPLDPFLQNNYS
jgi:hypothetical protein